MTPRFGIFPSPAVDDLPATRRLVAEADARGLDLVGIQDHPYQRRFLDTDALLAWVLATTERVSVFADVANLPLRHPAMLAKTAASLDVLSGGRFELGLGAGGFWDGIAGMGGPRRSPGSAVEATEEAIGILRRAWAGERGLASDGPHYPLEGYHAGPVPAHDISIWVGANGPRMLRLVGRLADGWVASSPYVPPDRLPDRHATIDAAAVAAGRDPSSIRRIYNISGRITAEPASDLLVGPPPHWAETLRGLHEDGRIDTFVLWPDGDDPVGQVAAFAELADDLRG